jgi:hypothetical protein
VSETAPVPVARRVASVACSLLFVIGLGTFAAGLMAYGFLFDAGPPPTVALVAVAGMTSLPFTAWLGRARSSRSALWAMLPLCSLAAFVVPLGADQYRYAMRPFIERCSLISGASESPDVDLAFTMDCPDGHTYALECDRDERCWCVLDGVTAREARMEGAAPSFDAVFGAECGFVAPPEE